MGYQDRLGRLLAIAGTGLVGFPILAPIVIAVMGFMVQRLFRFDYLMPAELFPSALVGGGLLLWAALRAHSRRAIIAGGLGAAVSALAGGQVLAVATGLASGEAELAGWPLALVLASLGIYSLALVVVGAGGGLLVRDLFSMPTIATHQTKLYHEVSGAGQPVVLIHGLGSSTRDWDAQVPEFARSYQVITVDLRGHGRSAKPAGPYQMALFAADLESLLQALGIASAHIVGLSLGGAVAFQFALDYPSRVRSLVLVNTGPTLGGTPEQAQQEIARRVGIVQQMGMRAMGQALAPNLFPKPEHAALRDTFIERWAENDPQAYIEATRSMLGWDVTARLGAITCPVLVIASDQDYTPVSAKEAYLKFLPNARLAVIPDAHHAVTMERPEAFNPVLAQFLAEQAS